MSKRSKEDDGNAIKPKRANDIDTAENIRINNNYDPNNNKKTAALKDTKAKAAHKLNSILKQMNKVKQKRGDKQEQRIQECLNETIEEKMMQMVVNAGAEEGAPMRAALDIKQIKEKMLKGISANLKNRIEEETWKKVEEAKKDEARQATEKVRKVLLTKAA